MTSCPTSELVHQDKTGSSLVEIVIVTTMMLRIGLSRFIWLSHFSVDLHSRLHGRCSPSRLWPLRLKWWELMDQEIAVPESLTTSVSMSCATCFGRRGG
jgi:hypothetical protein